MPYTIQIRTSFLQRPIPLAKEINGSLANNPGSTIETVTATNPGFGPDLAFVSAATPPAGAGTVHIVDNRTSGDLCRSGVVYSWPASPARCEIFTIATANTTFDVARFRAMTRELTGKNIWLPAWVPYVAGVVTGSMLAPTRITIGGVTVTPSLPNLVVITVVGTLFFRQLIFFDTATSFTANIALSIAPSGDAVDRSRIFAINVVGSSLNPGVITPGMNFVLSILGPIVAQFMSGEIEKLVNAEIEKEAHKAVTDFNPRASITPWAAICAQSVTITPGTLALSMVLSNPLGLALNNPAQGPATPELKVSMTPSAVDGRSRSYTFRVADATTNAGIDGATLEIANFTSSGGAQAINAVSANGGIAHITATLRARRIRVGGGTGANEFFPPILTVSKPGYAAFVMELLR